MPTIINNTVDEFHPSSAYHAGRLMAVCQHIQDLVAPDVGRTYVDSYFAAACVNPNLILPRVWKTARTRLRQIPRFDVKRDIEDLATRLVNLFEAGWPARLSLGVQALFQLGYFHQRANLPIPDTRRRLLTASGESVRSNGEKLIADILYGSGIKFEYETRLVVPDRSKESGVAEVIPDFTIKSSDKSRCLYVEFCGMLGVDEYDRQWTYKRSRFAKLGARTLKDVQTDSNVTEHTLMQVISEDVRDTHRFRRELCEAVKLVLALDCLIEERETPF